jgi:hypothetical protein
VAQATRDFSAQLQLTEVSALALRSHASELVAVGDDEFTVLTVKLDASGQPREQERHDVHALVADAGDDGSEFEGVACDGTGCVFLLREGPATVLVAAPDLAHVERTITLTVDASEPVIGPSWNEDPNKRGEGLLLLRDGHLLVLKQANPVALVEFGPSGDPAHGISPDTVLPAGEPFALPGSDASYVPLAVWELADGAVDDFPSLNDVAADDSGRVHVVSSKGWLIGRLEDRLTPGEHARIPDRWDLRDALGQDDDEEKKRRVEGLTLEPGGVALVGLDMKGVDENLFGLELA